MDVWDDFGMEYLQNFCCSIPWRLLPVIEAKDSDKKYNNDTNMVDGSFIDVGGTLGISLTLGFGIHL